mmetsp:Transcript_157/g.426  ORF Transcript_157/g.426 Transcript_157/m.426 type:complete len:98 (-) Transcript_157:101-394(-)
MHIPGRDGIAGQPVVRPGHHAVNENQVLAIQGSRPLPLVSGTHHSWPNQLDVVAGHKFIKIPSTALINFHYRFRRRATGSLPQRACSSQRATSAPAA